MGNIGKKDYARQKKLRALTLMRMFKKRIELDFFTVEVADWWTNNMDGGVTLRIDVKVEDLENLETLP